MLDKLYPELRVMSVMSGDRSGHLTMLSLLALAGLASLTSSAPVPEAYKQGGEARGLMDEALKKFYFDLYDQEDEAGPGSQSPGHEGHTFKFDDYFDTGNDNLASIVTPAIGKKKDSIETGPSINNRNTKLAPFPLPPPRNSPRLPVSPSQSQVAAPPSTAAVPASSQDPTFVLSRLLFHLSQLPSIL